MSFFGLWPFLLSNLDSKILFSRFFFYGFIVYFYTLFIFLFYTLTPFNYSKIYVLIIY